MSTALATQDVNMDELKRMGMMFALSGFFDTGNNYEVSTAQMAVKVLAGREIGFGPFAAVNGIHIIKGKPSISANIMAAAVKFHPTYDYRVRVMTDKEVVIDFFEIVDGKREKIGTSEFTAADAVKAQTQNMGKFPRNMLFARAMSNGVRWYCPDVFSGNSVYTPEELGARTDDDGYIIVDRQSGEVIEASRQLPTPAKSTEPAPSVASLADVDPLDFDDEDAITVILKDLESGVVPRPRWENKEAAKAWAVDNGTCANDFEATNSLKKIVTEQFDGKFTTGNFEAVMDAFYARQMEKLAEKAETEAKDPLPF